MVVGWPEQKEKKKEKPHVISLMILKLERPDDGSGRSSLRRSRLSDGPRREGGERGEDGDSEATR